MRARAQHAEPSRPYIVHSSTRPKRHLRWILISLLVLAAVLAIAAVFFARHWPFTRDAVQRDLEQATGATVEMHSFRRNYFPPGAVAEGVVLRQDGRKAPLATIQTLTVRASYPGMLRHHVAVLTADGLHATVGLGQSIHAKSGKSRTVIDHFQADRAILDVLTRNDRNGPTRFQIHQFRIDGLGSHDKLSFQVALSNPKPVGEVHATGYLGPWNSANPQQTEVDASYSFTNANLSTVKGVAGTLSSKGKFHGPISAIQVEGSTDMPDFAVSNVGHGERFSTTFRAVVNATNGDVRLPTATARIGNTAVSAKSDIIALRQNEGKTVSADFVVHDGRIENLLWLFMKDPNPPLAGPTSFKAHATLPPGDEKFLRKLRFVADFGIDEARFTHPDTEQKVSQLSERARGDANPAPDSPNVLSDLKGHVDVFGGIAHFSNLSFAVPGAIADLHGTYNLITKAVDLHGTVQAQVKLSETTTGAKSFLMKFVGKFSDKNRAGKPIPVSITGKFPKPSYKLDPI